MKEKPTSYLYNFYDKDDGDGKPIIVDFNGYKVQLGINVVIMPGFKIIPNPNHIGSITVIGSNSFIGLNVALDEGSELPSNTILQGDTLQSPSASHTVIQLTGDDLGRTKANNAGSKYYLSLGLLHHCSLMVNRGEDTDEAVDYISTNCRWGRVGLHLNFTEGIPLAPRANEDWYSVNQKTSFGHKMNSLRASFFLTSKEKKQLIDETLAQINKFIRLGGQPRFFDAHGNVHFKLPIARAITTLLIQAGFTHTRIPRNEPPHHKLYGFLFKRRVINLYRKHFVTPDTFINASDLFTSDFEKYRGKTIEIMTHPYIKNGKPVNRRDVSIEVICAFCQCVGFAIAGSSQ